jgi:hypothetical protein
MDASPTLKEPSYKDAAKVSISIVCCLIYLTLILIYKNRSPSNHTKLTFLPYYMLLVYDLLCILSYSLAITQLSATDYNLYASIMESVTCFDISLMIVWQGLIWFLMANILCY